MLMQKKASSSVFLFLLVCEKWLINISQLDIFK